MYFDFEPLETQSGERCKKFDFSINTDGVSVSFLMEITEPQQQHQAPTVPADDDDIPLLHAPNLRQIRQRFADNHYRNYVALDPGRILMVGGK